MRRARFKQARARRLLRDEWIFLETAMHIAYPYYLHVPPKPDPIPPGSPPGDLPVDPDTDEPDVDLPPLSPPGKEVTPPSP